MKIAMHEFKFAGVSSDEISLIGGHIDLTGITCHLENLARSKYSTVEGGKPSAVDRV